MLLYKVLDVRHFTDQLQFGFLGAFISALGAIALGAPVGLQ